MSFHQSLHVLLPNNQQSKPKCPFYCLDSSLRTRCKLKQEGIAYLSAVYFLSLEDGRKYTKRIVPDSISSETRTHNLQIRSLLLYPIELWRHEGDLYSHTSLLWQYCYCPELKFYYMTNPNLKNNQITYEYCTLIRSRTLTLSLGEICASITPLGQIHSLSSQTMSAINKLPIILLFTHN